MKISSSMFIHENVLIDPFMADLKTVVHLEPSRYLLRAPFLADQCFDQDPGGGFYAIPCFLASVQSKLMSLFRAISFQSTIASQFPADGGLMNFDKVCNFRLDISCFQKYVNLVSLPKVGKLRVGSHPVPVLCRCQCSFDLAGLRSTDATAATPLIPIFKVALVS
jgi:hypothetical protein